MICLYLFQFPSNQVSALWYVVIHFPTNTRFLQQICWSHVQATNIRAKTFSSKVCISSLNLNHVIRRRESFSCLSVKVKKNVQTYWINHKCRCQTGWVCTFSKWKFLEWTLPNFEYFSGFFHNFFWIFSIFQEFPIKLFLYN